MNYGAALPGSTSLSPNFYVRDLTVTNTGIPNDADVSFQGNLKALAQTLELLREIDTFTVVSGYRSPAVNSAVKGQPGSYHTQGLAADIVPHKLTPEQFWFKIHNNPRYRNAVGEYILYPEEHGSLHVSAPTATKRGFDLILNEAGQYVRSGIAYATENPVTVMAGVLSVGVILFAIYRLRSYG